MRSHLVPAKRIKKLEIERRRQHVGDLALQGWTQSAIADYLDISQATICDDLTKIRRQWRESTVRDFDLAQAESLQEINRVRREAWPAWELSKKPQQSAVLNGDGGASRKMLKNQHGDPRFLDIILKCNAAEQALSGSLRSDAHRAGNASLPAADRGRASPPHRSHSR